jgi:hypothetical protein
MQKVKSKDFDKICKSLDPIIDKIQGDLLFMQYNKIVKIITCVREDIEELLYNDAQVATTSLSQNAQDFTEFTTRAAYMSLNSNVMEYIKDNPIENKPKEIYLEMIRYLDEVSEQLRKDNEYVQAIIKAAEDEKEAKLEEILNIRINENHLKVVNDVNDKYLMSINTAAVKQEKLDEVSEIENLFKATEKIRYQTAVKIVNAFPEEVTILIEDYKKGLAKINDHYEYEKKIRNVVGRPKRTLEEYDIVKNGSLTLEQAAVFDYKELNTYGNYFPTSASNIKKLFEAARNFYPSDPNLGFIELAKVEFTQINYFLSDNFVKALRKRFITITQFLNYSPKDRTLINNLPDSNQLEAVMKYGLDPTAVSKAWCFDDVDTGGKSIEVIKKIYDNVEGSEEVKKIYAVNCFNKILTSSILNLKNDTQLYAIVILELDYEKIKKAKCFSEGETAYAAYDIIKEAYNNAEGSIENKINKAKEVFELIHDFTNKYHMLVFIRYDISIDDLRNSTCFNPISADIAQHLIANKYKLEEGDEEQKKAAARAIYNKIKNIDNRWKLEVVNKFDFEPAEVDEAPCFSYSKEYCIKLSEYLYREKNLQRRIELFRYIKDFRSSQLMAIIIFNFKPEEVKLAKCFNDECERIAIKIFKAIGPANTTQLKFVLNMIKDIDTRSKILEIVKVL